jgi:prenyltransferase beta subunit
MLARLSMLLSTYLNLEYIGKQPLITEGETTLTTTTKTVTKTVVITETVTVTEKVGTTQISSDYRGDLTTTLISISIIVILALTLIIARTPIKTKH